MTPVMVGAVASKIFPELVVLILVLPPSWFLSTLFPRSIILAPVPTDRMLAMLWFDLTSELEYTLWRLVIIVVISPFVSFVGSVVPEYTTAFGLKVLAPRSALPLNRSDPDRRFADISIEPPATVPVFVMILGSART